MFHKNAVQQYVIFLRLLHSAISADTLTVLIQQMHS